MVSRRHFLASASALAAAPYFYPVAVGATPRGIVVVGTAIDGIVNGFDPAEAYDASSDVLPNLYRTLITYDKSAPGLLRGDLAQRWDISSDGLVYRFTLEPGVKFGNGAPLTARDVAFSLQRAVKMNKSPSFLLTQLGLTAANVETSVQATAADTLTLSLPEIRAGGLVLATLSTTVASVVDEQTVRANEANRDLGNLWLRTHSAGAGSYRLVSWQAADRIILEANPNTAIVPKVPRLAIRHMAEPATELLQLKKADLDVARTLGSDELKTIAGDRSMTVTATDALQMIYLQMNMATPQFQKREVLQAVKWSIDYEAIADHVTPGLWTMWQSFLPNGTPGALAEMPFKRDLAKAKALLAAAGYPEGFSITFDHPNTWPFPDIAQAMQANLAEVGIRLQLLAGDYAQVLAKRRARQHQMQLGRFGADHIDSSSFASYFCPNTNDTDAAKVKNGAWNNHFVDEKLTTGALEADRNIDDARRLEMYRQLQRKFWEVAPFVFLLQKRDVAVARQGITGLAIGPINAYTRYAGIQKS